MDLPATQSRAWAYLTEPRYRVRWFEGAKAVTASGLDKGRTGVGTTHHCVHGKQVLALKIVDWRPFDYVTQEVPLPLGATNLMTFALSPIAGGTRASLYVQIDRQKGNPLQAALAQGMLSMMKRSFAKTMAQNARNLWRLVHEDSATAPEPQPEAGAITHEDVVAAAQLVTTPS